MKNKSCLSAVLDVKGFTLIELLVVVLIIGILASVAVPQYQKAVWRSRNAELKQLVDAVAKAEQVYLMANGVYADNFDELAIELPSFSAPKTSVGALIQPCNVRVQGKDSSRKRGDIQLLLGRTDGSTTPYVRAEYIAGKYKCAGFAKYPTGKLQCIERDNYTTINRGDFCKKVERATLSSPGSGSNSSFYTLP